MSTGFDQELYWAAVDGDRDAVRSIVESHSKSLLRLAICMGLPITSAEDAVHAAWMKFFRHLRQVAAEPDRALRDPTSLPAWLKTVTRNAVRDVYRTARRSRDLAERATFEAVATGSFVYQPDDAERLEHERQKSAMWRAIEELDETCRVILHLRLEDPPASYSDIATLIDRPEGSIGPTLGRCIEKLRRAMGVGADHD